jgi:hypothetical protein
LTINVLVQDSPTSSAQFNEAVTFTAGATVFACFRTGAATTVTCNLQPAGTTPTSTLVQTTTRRQAASTSSFENVPGGGQHDSLRPVGGGHPQIMAGEVTNPLTGGGGASIGPSTVNATASVTNWDGGAVTTTGANAEILGFCSGSAAVHMTQTGSYLISAVQPGDPNSRIAIVHQAVTATGTYTAASRRARRQQRLADLRDLHGFSRRSLADWRNARPGHAGCHAQCHGRRSRCLAHRSGTPRLLPPSWWRAGPPSRGVFGFHGGSVGTNFCCLQRRRVRFQGRQRRYHDARHRRRARSATRQWQSTLASSILATRHHADDPDG